jgi:hypothetical protein
MQYYFFGLKTAKVVPKASMIYDYYLKHKNVVQLKKLCHEIKRFDFFLSKLEKKLNRFDWAIIKSLKPTPFYAYLKVLSDENQGGSKVVSIASSFFTV